jgi:hypothetical protein
MVELLVARVPAILGKNLRQQSQQKNPHQDGHIRYQHGGVAHAAPGPFNRENFVFSDQFSEIRDQPYAFDPARASEESDL